MNRLVSAGIGALFSLAFAASASAAQLATVNPADPNFTLQGPITYTHGVTLNCSYKLTGTVASSGIATINTATVVSGACYPLPSPSPAWVLSATSSTNLQMSGFQFFGYGGQCGPSIIPMTWTGTAAQFTNIPMTGSPAPDCAVYGNLTATNLTVVP